VQPKTNRALKRIVIYCRISQDRTGAGLGVERQDAACRELLARLGFTEAEIAAAVVLIDNDMSATRRRKPRPGYRRLLEGLRQRQWDVLATLHNDRLLRNNRELEDFIAVVEANPLRIVTVLAGEYDLATATGRMTARIVGAVAQKEAEQEAERLREQRRQAAEMGRLHGGRRPFGWGAEVGKGTDGAPLIDRSRPHPLEASLIREAAVDVLHSGTTWGAVARRWNQADVLTPFGNRWTGQTVMQTLTAPRHAGLTIIRPDDPDGAVTYGHAKTSIITPEQHHALVELTRVPARRAITPRGRVHLLSGIARCGAENCEMPVQVAGTDRAGRPVYGCGGRRPGIPHRGHANRPTALVEEAVTRLVCARLARSDAVMLLTPDDGPAKIAAEEARQVRERRKRAAARWMLGELDDDEWAAVKAEADPLLADLERRAAPPPAALIFEGLVGLGSLGATRKAWDAIGDLDRRRTVVDALLWITILPTGRWGVASTDGGSAAWLRYGWKL